MLACKFHDTTGLVWDVECNYTLAPFIQYLDKDMQVKKGMTIPCLTLKLPPYPEKSDKRNVFVIDGKRYTARWGYPTAIEYVFADDFNSIVNPLDHRCKLVVETFCLLPETVHLYYIDNQKRQYEVICWTTDDDNYTIGDDGHVSTGHSGNRLKVKELVSNRFDANLSNCFIQNGEVYLFLGRTNSSSFHEYIDNNLVITTNLSMRTEKYNLSKAYISVPIERKKVALRDIKDGATFSYRDCNWSKIGDYQRDSSQWTRAENLETGKKESFSQSLMVIPA